MNIANERKLQKALYNHDIIEHDNSTHLCTNCGYKHEHTKYSMKWSIGLTITGILGILLSILINTTWMIGSFLILAVGLYGISTNNKKYVKCPNCEKNTYIPIDSDEAQQILRENNITVAEKFQKESNK